MGARGAVRERPPPKKNESPKIFDPRAGQRGDGSVFWGGASLAPVFASVACEKLAVRGNVPHGLGRVSPCQFYVVSVAGASGVVDPPGKSRFVASTRVATGLRRSTEGVLRRLIPITSVYLGACQLFSCVLCDRSAFLYRSGCVEPQSRCRDVTRLYTKALVSCMKPALLSTSRSKFASLIRRPGFRDALATMILGLTPHFHGGVKKNHLPSGLLRMGYHKYICDRSRGVIPRSVSFLTAASLVATPE